MINFKLQRYALFRKFAVFLVLLGSFSCLADENYPFSVENEQEGTGHRILAKNNGPAPVSVKVSIVDFRNIAADRLFPAFAVVPPNGGILYLGRIRPRIAGLSYSFRTQIAWMLGDYNASQSPDAIYRLPYKDGQAFRITQASGGPVTTHNTPENQFAVDITVPEGTPIIATRDGVVIHTEANQVYGGKHPDLLSKANDVRVLHVDGTIATYAHLAPGGVYAYPGQRISAGTQIGLAGSTGYSSGPHLHFVVQRVAKSDEGFSMVSLPFRFYVGNPPLVFLPQYGVVTKADYTSASRTWLPTESQKFAHTPQLQPALSNMVGSPQPNYQLDVLPSLRSLLLRIEGWQWVAGIASIVLLLLLLGKMHQAHSQPGWSPRTRREPTTGPGPARKHSHHGLGPKDDLVRACSADRGMAERLMAYEYSKAPMIDDDEAARRALDRLVNDRR